MNGDVFPSVLEHPVVDIVIAVHEALPHVQRCVESVLRHTDPAARIILVNDGCGPECSAWLRRAVTATPRLELVEHAMNRGYTCAANSGLRQARAPYVVLLNSDTIVTSGWLAGLLRCAESSPAIGIVGPLSNAASWQSVPHVHDADGRFAVNRLPEGYSADDFARLVGQLSQRAYPRTPLVNGFCMLIKQPLLERLGLLDELNFAAGYGEENDYCLRAVDAGFELAIADDVYVYHAKSQSFGAERRAHLAPLAQAILKEKHGAERLAAEARRAQNLPALAEARRALAAALDRNAETRAVAAAETPAVHAGTLRVLFVLPERSSGGGVHSVVQETARMCGLGALARVAVREADLPWYLAAYRRLSVARELFLPFAPDALREKAPGFEVIVATSYASVELCAKLRETQCQALFVYYVQDYEPHFFETGSPRWHTARASYERIEGALLFAKSDWLVRKVEAEHGITASRVTASLDHSLFEVASRSPDGKVRICAMVRPQTPRRNAALTMRVLREIVRRYPDRAEAHVFGCYGEQPEFRGLPQDFPFVNYGLLSHAEVASLFQGCDIFADFSTYQAFGRGALEAMACGCAVIVPAAGGADEYAQHGHNALVVETSDEAACVAGLERLVTDDAERRRLSLSGPQTAAGYSIDRAVVSELNLFAEALAKRRGTGWEPIELPPDGELDPTGGLRVLPRKRFFSAARSAIRKVRGARPGISGRINAETAAPRPLFAPSNHMNDNRIVRKVKKLVRSPEQFFSDSSHAALQRLGGMLKRDPHRPTDEHLKAGASSPTPAKAGNGRGSPSSSRLSRQAQAQNRPTESALLAEHADDARKLAGFAAALAATDYPTAGESVVTGLPSYRATGLEFLRYFVKWGELAPEDDVLDVGCGGGCMAAALGYYLASSSNYVGFDVDKGSIDRCRDAIGKRWPNFRFDHLNLRSSKGALTGQSFLFPYADTSFSFVIATSVFTHLTRQEVKHYLREAARVLRHDGRLFATAYLMTPAAEVAARNNAHAVKFDHEFGENPVQILERPMAAVAQRERAFVADVNEVGLVIERIAHGWWSGLRTSNGKQDIVVLRKP